MLRVSSKGSSRIVSVTTAMAFLCLLCIVAGCDGQRVFRLPARADKLSVYASYAAVEVEIMALTELVVGDSEDESKKIKAYVSLVDFFGCQVKGPGVFRFELYRRVRHRSEPKGKRVAIWPDIDLIRLDKNNEYWQDFLRAYEFELDFEGAAADEQGYVLQVTCTCPGGRRLLAEYKLGSK